MFNELRTKIDRVRGTRDVLPDEYEVRSRAWKKIQKVFHRFGYNGIEVPSIERVDLHLRKSGESIRKNMYIFKDHGQENMCLRPELTASVVRMYNDGLQNHPLPLKLYYQGSAFRYERPQKGRYREFTQVGVELIGGKSSEFDAEIIILACNVLDSLGIENYEVVIGNIGITLELLSQKKIEERVKNYIIESLEKLSKATEKGEGIDKIKRGLNEIGISLEEYTKEQKELMEAVHSLPEVESKKVIEWVIQTIYGNTDFGRNSEDITRNLFAKIRREEQKEQILKTLEFIDTLTKIRGVPPDVFKEVDQLIKDYDLDPKPIDELRLIAEYLNCYGIDWNKVKIDFGFGRGLQYYTGMIFEININSEELGISQKQVCGGGRYDSLINDLGGNLSVPALGFSFGFERLILCLSKKEINDWFLDIFVAPIGEEEEFRYALNIVDQLRKANLRTDIGLKGLSPRDQTGMAKGRRARFILFLGSDEIANGYVSLRDMSIRKQVKCSLDEAIEQIKNGVLTHE